MADNVLLQLVLTDVYGKGLREKIDVLLHHQVLNETLKTSATPSASGIIKINGLRGAPQGLYRIEIDPPAYQYVSRFLNMKASGTTKLEMTFPIDPGKVKKVNFPAFASLTQDLQSLLQASNGVLSFNGKSGPQLYDALDDIRRAGLLNIAAKTAHTPLAGAGTVFPLIRELQEIRGDRFFAVVLKELLEDTKNSVAAGMFHKADESLHHPPPGFSHAGSFKTADHYGNLQLTFFMSGNDFVADIDIDDAAGLEHVFQVVHNKVSGQPTHPYNIHEILVGYQHIDPGYTFEV